MILKVFFLRLASLDGVVGLFFTVLWIGIGFVLEFGFVSAVGRLQDASFRGFTDFHVYTFQGPIYRGCLSTHRFQKD